MNRGIFFGLGAFLMWGFFPVYFRALQGTDALQIVFHRVVWSFLFLAVVITVRKNWGQVGQKFRSRKTLAIYSLAAVLLAINWLVYVWAVNSGHVIESSLGYYINPLVSVALGVIILREKLRPLQWVPVGMAALGVLYLTFSYGALPWIALTLAFSFGLYGLVKKMAPLNSLHGLTLETAILFLPSFAFLLLYEFQGTGSFGHTGVSGTLLLAFSGVLTSLPLLLFASAARAIPLSLLGILQYVAPTTQFLLGLLLFKEPFSGAQLVGFSIIWVALFLFSVESYVTSRRKVMTPI
jgi:chloramphenicol-sensitive protein RarD